MSKSNLDATSLAATTTAAVAALLLSTTSYSLLASIAGFSLFLVLLSYDEEGYRSILQSVAFAAACALCLTVASVIPYQYIYGLPTTHEPELVNKWLPLTWAFTTLLITLIDRARMGARLQTAAPGAASLGSVLSPRVSVPVATPEVAPPPPVVSHPPAPPERVDHLTPHLVRNEEPSRVAAPAPVNLVEIYVHLTGESLNLMRTVRAEPLGRDYFRIADTMPENETWQFTPGMVVRCKKQNLSTGKAMVAVEEAPRAQ